jgi:hypothetical protein
MKKKIGDCEIDRETLVDELQDWVLSLQGEELADFYNDVMIDQVKYLGDGVFEEVTDNN